MSAKTLYQASFRAGLTVSGELIVYTCRDQEGTPAAMTAAITSLGPADESRQKRVAGRFTVEFLESDLVTASGIALTPQKRDTLVRSETGVELKVLEIELEWGVYTMICEYQGRPVVPR